MAIYASVLYPQDMGVVERLLLFAVGLIAVWVAWQCFPFTRTTLDRQTGLLVHEESRVTRTIRKDFPLQAVSRAEIIEGGSGSDGLTGLVFMINGLRFPVECGTSSDDKSGVASTINAWLNTGHPS